MFKKINWIAISFFIIILVLFTSVLDTQNNSSREGGTVTNEGGLVGTDHPLSIEYMRKQEYPGSDIVFEQTLTPGSNYQRHIVSYKSEGLKIFSLLTIPNAVSPENGFPAIVFNHGYIPPGQYRTTEKYVAYQDAFAKAGYITLKSDYRGHGNSEGVATGGYGSPAYTIDILNALSSIKKLQDPSTSFDRPGPIVNADRIGMWGHSMGGHITLRSMVVSSDIKAGVIWAGVVASYPDLFERWRRREGPTPTPNPNSQRGRWRNQLYGGYGSPDENPEFWASISPNTFVSDISGPIQLHHGTADSSVPLEFSQILNQNLTDTGKTSELFEYPGDNHNISNNLSVALNRSVEFFDLYLK